MPSSRTPPRSDWWFNFIRDRVAGGYLRKHCHALRLAKSSAALPADDAPILVAMNHPSWWDPLIAFVLSRQLPGYKHFGVIDAAMLKKYAMLKKAGIFGIDTHTLRGATEFLEKGQAILEQPRHAFWVTAQGEFADVRQRPLALRSGVGHLAARLSRGWVVPLAMEIGFWNERTPEALAKFGEAIPLGGESGKAMTAKIEAALTATLDDLNRDAISRDAGRFVPVLSGRVGVGGVYDWWRRFRATVTGRPFDASHGRESS
ncbi:lysophospholipid acyltransferase family protein [Limnoglobus roseus]|uniref:Acyltransferase n=1 Tax=Limnoglobus roseus TaxID=2598579 RepID=A0A5C1A317_9BACT|nr:lysophospholipid acyltransferase family protein [Limnoglobus roseus]QEL13499.1 acyltransferase [Limnoglobus roseus]